MQYYSIIKYYTIVQMEVACFLYYFALHTTVIPAPSHLQPLLLCNTYYRSRVLHFLKNLTFHGSKVQKLNIDFKGIFRRFYEVRVGGAPM